MLTIALLLALQDPAVDWKKDYETALQEAKKGDRYIVVVFGGPDCPPCAKMKETTFKDKAVVERVNQAYVNVYVHLDGPHPTAKQFGVEVIPTIFLVT